MSEETVEISDTQPPDNTGASVESVAVEAQELINSDVIVQTACISLLSARRLGHVASGVLERRLEELNSGNRKELSDWLRMSMRTGADAPFHLPDLMNALSMFGLRMLAAEQAMMREQSEEEDLQEAIVEAQVRNQQTIDIGFVEKAERGQTYVLVGETSALSKALQFVGSALQKTIDSAGEDMHAVRLSDADIPAYGLKKEWQYREVGRSVWYGKGESGGAIQKALRGVLLRMQDLRIDVVLVDSLQNLHPQHANPQRVPPTAMAADCLKQVSRAFSTQNPVIIHGLDAASVDTSLSAWQTLLAHSRIVPVKEDQEGLHIGDFLVPSE